MALPGAQRKRCQGCFGPSLPSAGTGFGFSEAHPESSKKSWVWVTECKGDRLVFLQPTVVSRFVSLPLPSSTFTPWFLVHQFLDRGMQQLIAGSSGHIPQLPAMPDSSHLHAHMCTHACVNYLDICGEYPHTHAFEPILMF